MCMRFLTLCTSRALQTRRLIRNLLVGWEWGNLNFFLPSPFSFLFCFSLFPQSSSFGRSSHFLPLCSPQMDVGSTRMVATLFDPELYSQPHHPCWHVAGARQAFTGWMKVLPVSLFLAPSAACSCTAAPDPCSPAAHPWGGGGALFLQGSRDLQP